MLAEENEQLRKENEEVSELLKDVENHDDTLQEVKETKETLETQQSKLEFLASEISEGEKKWKAFEINLDDGRELKLQCKQTEIKLAAALKQIAELQKGGGRDDRERTLHNTETEIELEAAQRQVALLEKGFKKKEKSVVAFRSQLAKSFKKQGRLAKSREKMDLEGFVAA